MSNTRFRDYTGQRFYRFVVLRRIGSKRYKPPKESKRKSYQSFALWLAVCDCGKEFEVASNYLRTGKARSCGCALFEWRHRKGRVRTGYEDGKGAQNYVLHYYQYSKSAKTKGWGLDAEQALALFLGTCHYCGASPNKVKITASGSFTYNGIDRKNNLQGYYPDNVVSCCETCNLAKRNLTYEDFVSWLARAGRHQSGEIPSQTTFRPIP